MQVRSTDKMLTLNHAINIAGLLQATSHWLLTTRPNKHQERDFLRYLFTVFRCVATDRWAFRRAVMSF
ncbi:gamma-glutamyl ligase [Enterobacter hormaechei ATCC 49162]|nr:gamma-glutamyl ligase [Enterobacter hormaechei ATCC 49162]